VNDDDEIGDPRKMTMDDVGVSMRDIDDGELVKHEQQWARLK
jgi:hypothetical protein